MNYAITLVLLTVFAIFWMYTLVQLFLGIDLMSVIHQEATKYKKSLESEVFRKTNDAITRATEKTLEVLRGQIVERDFSTMRSISCLERTFTNSLAVCGELRVSRSKFTNSKLKDTYDRSLTVVVDVDGVPLHVHWAVTFQVLGDRVKGCLKYHTFDGDGGRKKAAVSYIDATAAFEQSKRDDLILFEEKLDQNELSPLAA